MTFGRSLSSVTLVACVALATMRGLLPRAHHTRGQTRNEATRSFAR